MSTDCGGTSPGGALGVRPWSLPFFIELFADTFVASAVSANPSSTRSSKEVFCFHLQQQSIAAKWMCPGDCPYFVLKICLPTGVRASLQ